MSGSTQNLGINITSNVSRGLPGINRTGNALADLRTNANGAANGIDNLENSAQSASNDLSSLRDSIDRLNGGLSELKALSAGAFSADAIIDFGKEIISTAGKYEKFQAILANNLGPEAARRAFAQIQDYASKTPYAVDEITDSFIKLVNRGFKPTTQQLTQIGDLAASQGKSFDQLTEAILDAQTGEFERLKEFGITAQQTNAGVTLSFKDQTVTVEKNSEAVRNAILAFGDLNGVAGATAKVSQTLEGTISNLGDSWERFQAQLGKSLLPATKVVLQGLTDTLNGLTEALARSGQAGREFRINETSDKAFNEALNGLNAAAAKGAKAEKDYRAQLAKIQSDYYDKEIESLNKLAAARGSVQKEFFKDQSVAFSKSIKSIDDAIAEFEKQRDEASKGTSFGSAKDAKTLDDVLQGLRKDLVALDVAFAGAGGSLQKLNEDKIRLLTTALKDAADFGVRPGSDVFDSIKSQIEQLQGTLKGANAAKISIPITIEPLPTIEGTTAIKGLTDDFTRAFQSANDKAINEILQNGARDAVSGIATGIGKALAGGGISSVFDSFINALASLGEALGKQLIAQGIAIEAFKTSLASLKGVQAIVAGGALIAASAAFRAIAKGGVASFATGGGVVAGPQLAVIGDNPGREEYVIPSEVLDKMGGSSQGTLMSRLSVNEFIVWLERGYRNG